jgi:hypothetical protein
VNEHQVLGSFAQVKPLVWSKLRHTGCEEFVYGEGGKERKESQVNRARVEWRN